VEKGKGISLFLVLMFSCFTTAHAFFGFNKKPKGVEYYILGDNLANEIDSERTMEVDINKPEEGFRFYGEYGICYIRGISSFGRLLNGWYSQRLIEETVPSILKNIRRFKLVSTNSTGMSPTLFAYEPTRLDREHMCDEQLAFVNNVFQIEPSEENRLDEPLFIEPSKKYKGIASGIVPLSAYDFSTTKGVDSEDMEGIKVFVPAVKRGEVSTEQFKMQLRMNKAVNKGTIRMRRKAEQIDPSFGSYLLLEAEPVVEEVKSIPQNILMPAPKPTIMHSDPQDSIL